MVGEYRRRVTRNSNGKYSIGENCFEVEGDHRKPKKINKSQLKVHLPFNQTRTHTLGVKTMFGGMRYKDFVLKSGQVYDTVDGRRLILQVDCTTIIYLLVNNKGANTYQFYVQEINSFAYDVTVRAMAHLVVQSSALIKTIVKYEMYFILGVVSTLSIPMLITVVGVDILKTSVINKNKAKAAREFSKILIEEHHNIAAHSPTLHSKIKEFITADATINLKTYGYKLGKTIVSDQQVQGELAGALFAKALVVPQSFNFWVVLTTILTTAATKSVTKSPKAYLAHYGDRYKPIIDDLMELDWDSQQSANEAGQKISLIMQDSGVKISPFEASALVREVKQNSVKLSSSLININNGLKKFLDAIK